MFELWVRGAGRRGYCGWVRTVLIPLAAAVLTAGAAAGPVMNACVCSPMLGV